ncbi:hypothetical protein GlitD10_2223 [Gloeomargarita lithophora Alchichica-D10]|uniref:Uncharacterized protein n=1 Tax=Gloeomargarita lithophora Alchichica-D10 TaxID=1188229 RepID=A0A1J0AF44_9CYAN|nr:hypothetical protein [Gloeomargarita lithophora]APB34553.1 hypothetical protein GlitD10_2223 [Gloeomargarita lithophora Alchichica-D10]
MTYQLVWTKIAEEQYNLLRTGAKSARDNREVKGISKASKPEGLFKQIAKALNFLQENPRHPGLNTHEYHSLPHPYKPNDKVFEAYVQNKTPGAYRIFWCYGPQPSQLTIIAIGTL